MYQARGITCHLPLGWKYGDGSIPEVSTKTVTTIGMFQVILIEAVFDECSPLLATATAPPENSLLPLNLVQEEFDPCDRLRGFDMAYDQEADQLSDEGGTRTDSNPISTITICPETFLTD